MAGYIDNSSMHFAITGETTTSIANWNWEPYMPDWNVNIDDIDDPSEVSITLAEVNYLVKVCKNDRKLASIVSKLFEDDTEIIVEF